MVDHPLRTRVKICCITNPLALDLAVRHGADALGLVGPMPSGTGIIDLATARDLVTLAPPGVATFLLSCATEPENLIEQARITACSTLQIVDRVPAGTYAAIRRALPALKIVQVIHVEDESALDEAEAAAAEVDAILLDSGSRAGPVLELGGTGRVHDWAISRRIVERLRRPVFLAGGLRPDNVAEAIRAVRPYGIDLCTGLRTDGKLDGQKVASFMAAVATTAGG